MTRTFVIVILAVFTGVGLNPSAQAEGYWRKKVNDFLGQDKQNSSGSSLSREDIGKAFKQALSKGTEQVVARLGKHDGFNADSVIRILLPDELQKARNVLKKIGKEKYANDLELRLNRAAELATPKARALFLKAIKSMSFKDVMEIYKGPDDSATRYFRKVMTPDLARAMRPIVDDSLAKVKATRSYEKFARRYNRLPLTKKLEADLGAHVVDKGMAGIFHYMAKEEAAIRKDPARQTTDLLKKVFGVR